ncbi:DUF3990 domain-containing protein [Blautia producta]|uniref:DUF3990 domain-containing protein n=1 Tax=Blautia producta TaxID=33035 RepID=UPI001FA8B087|nr:DUF3990 domain-containing protein [Blautia coccoides]
MDLLEQRLFSYSRKIRFLKKYLYSTNYSWISTKPINLWTQFIEGTAFRHILYHGSNIAFDKISLSKSRNRRDFGRGFYCTISEEQAAEWAKRMYIRNFSGKQYVYQYIFHESGELKIKHFTELDTDWLEFMKDNRTKDDIQHSYDVVIGPVVDNNMMDTVQLYISGTLEAYEAAYKLRYNKFSNQVSFHTEKALKHLFFENCKEV